MVVVGCYYCQTGLEIPLPEEGGPDYGSPIRCADCGKSFVMDPPAEEDPQPIANQSDETQEPVPYEQSGEPRVVMSYAERMMAEQLEAEDQREYEAALLVEEQAQCAEVIRWAEAGIIGLG